MSQSAKTIETIIMLLAWWWRFVIFFYFFLNSLFHTPEYTLKTTLHKKTKRNTGNSNKIECSASWAIDLKAMTARGIIFSVKSN